MSVNLLLYVTPYENSKDEYNTKVMKSTGGSWSRRTSKDMSGIRRQRSLEWRERGYSSSEEEIPTRPVDSHVFASLLAQAQQEYSENSIALQEIKAVECDGTVVNTGIKGGVIRLLEEHLQKSLQWFVCLLHANELPIQHLSHHVNGNTFGPRDNENVSNDDNHTVYIETNIFPSDYSDDNPNYGS
ncbi:unnamed protein product [Diabrotica balteata]|uniref:Uncharacterized protein n=1 Tax=Diabrotica balteata TaxID=107213 RepID=A0A9N9TB92_DIABA|nr:unnamed protein product [Diabrotica balteata]